MSEQAVSPECERVRPELSALVDGELTPAERQGIEPHLAGCAACRAEVALLDMVTRSLGLVARPEPSEAMRQRLLAQVMAELPPQRLEIVCREQVGPQTREWREVRRFRAAYVPPSPSSEHGLLAGPITRHYVQTTRRQGNYTQLIILRNAEHREAAG